MGEDLYLWFQKWCQTCSLKYLNCILEYQLFFLLFQSTEVASKPISFKDVKGLYGTSNNFYFLFFVAFLIIRFIFDYYELSCITTFYI